MIRLRPYRDTDAETILSWVRDPESFYKWTAGILGDFPIDAEAFHKVRELMAFTAMDDDEIVGFFTMRQPFDSFDELRFGFVIVDPQKRRQGCGKKMLRLGMAYAKDIFGAQKASLGVFENNMPAYYCYTAAGFCEKKRDITEAYSILGQEWKCIELEAEL